MISDDIARIAREAGDDWDHTLPKDRKFLIRFAFLVAAHERKACCTILEGMDACVDHDYYAQAAKALLQLRMEK